MYRLIIPVILAAMLGTQIGCAAILPNYEIAIRGSRIDEVEHSQKMTATPYRCLFVDCNNQGGTAK